MQRNSRIYVAGHRGLVGSSLLRGLEADGYNRLITRTHAELDLTKQADVEAFFADEKPEYVFLAAAKVGGIHANNVYPAEFLSINLAIQNNVIEIAYRQNVERLLFLGSSCIYPKNASQPLKEEYLLTGPLEPTNRSYAIAKIAGIEMCWAFNRQHDANYLAAMPTNLYGPGDNYHPIDSHVIPALIRKFHDAKIRRFPSVTVWGSGAVRREFLYSDDLADAAIFLMTLPQLQYKTLLGSDEVSTGVFMPPVINIGTGEDMTIKELAEMIRDVVGYKGEISFDKTKPDGTPRKLLDVTRLTAMGWKSKTELFHGLMLSYDDFKTHYP